jgi:nicotinamide mononucleotide transporter
VTFTPLEIAAVAFILANVWLAVKENIWTWPTGIVGVVLYLVVNWRAHLYANALLQVFYFVLSVHGWYEWLHGGKNKSERQVSNATRRIWLATLAGGAILTLPMWLILRHSGSSPLMDAGTTAYSVVGQFLLNYKITENWVVWAVVDIVYVVIYIQQSLYLTAALYALFVILCVKGWIDWRRTALAIVTAEAPIEP